MHGTRTLVLPLSLLLAACGGGGSGDGGDDPGGGGASWHATGLGSSWTALATNVQPASEGEGSLEVGADGVPFAGYSGLNLDPHVRRWSGTDWAALDPFPAGADPLAEVAVARSPSGEPAAFWIEPEGVIGYAVRGATFTAGAWADVGAPANDVVANPSAYYLHAASGAKGPVVAWKGRDDTLGDAAWVARLEGSGWVPLGGAKVLANWGDVSVATTPSGDPVVGYVDGSDLAVVERWSDASGWEALPAPPFAFGDPLVEVAADGLGTVYALAMWTEGYHLQIDAVYRLAPGAAAWESLGKPPGFSGTYTRVSLAGLPAGGVAAAWAYSAGAGLARHVAGAWETIRAPSGSYGGQMRPMIAVAGDDDLFLGFANTAGQPSMSVSRHQRY